MKRVMSIESDVSIPKEGLMADTKCAGRKEEFFRIKLGANLMSCLRTSRIVVDNSLFVFVFLSNG